MTDYVVRQGVLWDAPNAWTPGGVPGTGVGDTVTMANRTVTYNQASQSIASLNLVIAHLGVRRASGARCDDSTNRMVSRTEALLAFAVLTTERKAA